MSDYTSGAITFTGLGNGTDFDALIDGLIEVERQRVTRLETWRQTWENKIEAFQELNTKMLALKTTLSAMNTTSEFLTKIASSGDSSALTASASSSAQEASHSVEIGQLAQNDIFITSSGTGALTSSVTSADTSLTLSYAGES
ncbi:MAG: flagellar cap protein FliD N-terminal domain-containing protein, partial [Desulfovibrionaceae bacterium]|nr:flagellar cap protein FliD N-terminal domain-containing protein [Desulfovibrionaceae bacterium]